MDARPIGIFDSGVGGLTVAKEITRLLPFESFVYVGDTARAPYGTKTPAQLIEYAQEIITFLLTQDIKAIVIACGTSSANTLQPLQKIFTGLPIVDVIHPTIGAMQTPGQRLGLIATPATVKSGVFQHLAGERLRYVKACPLFAQMVETGITASHPAARFAAHAYLTDMRGQIDALILGCTHFPLLKSAIVEAVGDVEFIDMGLHTALALQKCLNQHSILAPNGNKPTYSFYVSGAAKNFRTVGSKIYKEVLDVCQITLR